MAGRELVAIRTGSSTGGRHSAAPVVEAEDDSLTHDHCDGLTKASSGRLGRNTRHTEHDEVEDIYSRQENEVDCWDNGESWKNLENILPPTTYRFLL